MLLIWQMKFQKLLRVFCMNKKNAAILGFGIEGQSTSRWLIEQGIEVTIYDEKKKLDDVADALNELKISSLKYYFGIFPDLSNFDLIIVSPGIRFDIPVLENARKKNILVTTATNLFLENCPAKAIGVTGTKGKGTSSALIFEMLKADGIESHLGGNIGTPPLDFLDKLTGESVVVLELSSFQIMTMLYGVDIAVILMTTSEHLDFHRNENEYVSAKANLVRLQDISGETVVNIDYPNSKRIGDESGKGYWEVSVSKIVRRGSYVRDGNLFFSDGKKEELILHTGEIFIPGNHNWENAAAATVAARLAGVSYEAIRNTLKTFKGLPHRLELVREVDGVRYYDDSFSTTPETAIAAIKAFKEHKVLILGGSSKNSDFSELGSLIGAEKSIRAIVGVGMEWERIKKKIKIQNSKFKVIGGCKDMEQIVEAARSAAKPGDVVLLTPACASFDMFKNYKVRGDQFKHYVNTL